MRTPPRALRAEVDLLLPDDTRVTVGHGAILGRLTTADVHLPHPRVSEAHALISHRGRQLRILGLRSRFVIDGQPATDHVLQPGMTVHFATDVAVRVLDVRLPEHVLALDIDGLGVVVPEGLSSITGGDLPSVRTGWSPEGICTMWPGIDGWYRDGTPPVRVEPGQSWKVGEVSVKAVTVPSLGGADTDAGTGFVEPLTVEVYFDTVQIKRPTHPVVFLRSKSARIVSELALALAPLPWQDLARSTWGDEPLELLRKRWDTHMYRLRRKLRHHGINPLLVRADGTGLVELVLRSNDELIDRT